MISIPLHSTEKKSYPVEYPFSVTNLFILFCLYYKVCLIIGHNSGNIICGDDLSLILDNMMCKKKNEKTSQ